MTKLSFAKDRSPIAVSTDKTLMENLLEAEIPVASSCHGQGVCTKCLIEVKEGAGNLSPANERELELRAQHNIPNHLRVSCQTYVRGPATIDAPYW